MSQEKHDECVEPTVIEDVFFFNDTATTEIYTLPLHDALPILPQREMGSIKSWGAATTKTGSI